MPKRPGVYGIAGAPPSERQEVLAVCLERPLVASHLTAAHLWGLQLPRPTEIEVVGPRVALPGVRSHQSSTLVARDVARLGALRLTGPARTLVDCSGRVPPERLGPVVDDALRRGLVQLRALHEVFGRVATGPGRRATVAMRQVLAERGAGYDPGDSIRELALLDRLTAAGLPAPVLGQRVRIGRSTYKLDIAWPEHRAGLEYDSWAFHRGFTPFHRDRQKLRRLTAAGWRILPVTSQTDLAELVAELRPILLSCDWTTPGVVETQLTR